MSFAEVHPVSLHHESVNVSAFVAGAQTVPQLFLRIDYEARLVVFVKLAEPDVLLTPSSQLDASRTNHRHQVICPLHSFDLSLVDQHPAFLPKPVKYKMPITGFLLTWQSNIRILVLMQADYLVRTVSAETGEYNPVDMARRMTRPRSAYGKHLAELRKAAGLTQVELAGILGVPQSNIAFWEQSEKPPRSDVLPAMAQAFGVRLEELLKVEAEKRTAAKKKNGPTGRVREVFDRVSKLPRRQQEKIVEFVSAFVTQYEQNRQG